MTETIVMNGDGGGDVTASKARITRFKLRPVEPVGRWFVAFVLRQHRLGTSTSEEHVESAKQDAKPLETEGLVIEDDIQYLKSLDPRKWKDQDHYRVLGLRTWRYKATEEDIRKAYRQKVLKHHPDKRMAAGEKINRDEDYFACITRAFETLGTQAKRISYDSVDPEFDDDVPSANASSKAKFFEVFGPVFEHNARWSTIEPVPLLGDMNSTREHVENFYSFWYDFESWREFSYLDEEEKEKGQDREERRWIEKQNKAARKMRRKAEVGRVRELVDNAYNCDPRISKFREAEKEKKAAEKRARQEAIRLKKEKEEQERMAAEAEARRIKEEAEAEEKAKQDALKKEREKQKKAIKNERKSLRTFCKENNYFIEDESERVQAMEDVEKLCEMLDLMQLKELNESLASPRAAEVFKESCAKVNSKLKDEKDAIVEQFMRGGTGTSGSATQNGEKPERWNHDDLQLLIKAVNLFPAGTSQRWEVVSNFVNQHTKSSIKRTAKEVLNKAKTLSASDAATLKTAVNEQAYSKFEQSHKPPPVVPDTSTKADEEAAPAKAPAPAPAPTPTSTPTPTPSEPELVAAEKPWSTEEQKMLEQALRTFPATVDDRWGKIAGSIPGRTKKECMKRFKELAEMVKAKKAATQGVKKKP